MPVEIAIQLPDDVADKLRRQDRNLNRLGLEKLVCSLYRDGSFSQAEAMRDLGVASRLAFEEMLARHHSQRDWPAEEVDAELATLDRLQARA
jgi:hypothetical protein